MSVKLEAMSNIILDILGRSSREEGIPQQTLTRWKNEAKANGTPAPTGDSSDSWSAQD